MAEIRWTVEAETWLKDIYDYITQDNPSAAAKALQEYTKRCNYFELKEMS